MPAQGLPTVSDNDSNPRKRVGKACDRCRLKKSKCDGSSPCSRCRADNAICVFGERKRSHDKVYPKGYVEMLEQQQNQLVNGIRELYMMVINERDWEGEPLEESINGHPLTHDILDRLGVLKPDGEVEMDGFEDDLDVLRRKLAPEAEPTLRKDSTDSDPQSQTTYPEPSSPKQLFNDQFSLSNQFPPTPPIQNPHEQHSINYDLSSHTNPGMNVDQTVLQQQQTWPMTQPINIYGEGLGYRYTPTFADPVCLQQMHNPPHPHHVTTTPWVDDELNSFNIEGELT